MIGAGTMGGGIAMNFANAGIPVTVLEADRERLDKGIATIRKSYEGSAKKGKLTAAQVEERMGLIRPTLSYADVAPADIVVEAVFEDMAVKQGVFKTLDETMKPGAILATNTSTLDLDALARATRRPADVIGTHFFSPAHVMKLLEVVRGAETGKDVLATVMGLARDHQEDGGRVRRVRRVHREPDARALPAPVPASSSRKARCRRRWTARSRTSGWPWDRSGCPTWPATTSAGHPQAALRASTRRASARCIADRLCEQGRFGQKTGAGWYRYEAGPPRRPPRSRRRRDDRGLPPREGHHRRGPSPTTRSSIAASSPS